MTQYSEIFTFSENPQDKETDTWLVAGSISANYFVVAGGGGSGYDGYNGGNGNSITGTIFLNLTQSRPIVIGAGGAGATTNASKGCNGTNSVFSSFTAIGGVGGDSNIIDVSSATNSGSDLPNIVSVNGAANTGSGGVSDDNNKSYSVCSGCSGVVIISYSGTKQFNGGSYSSSGGNSIHTFNSSGLLSPI